MSKNRKIGTRLTSDIHQFRLKAMGAGRWFHNLRRLNCHRARRGRAEGLPIGTGDIQSLTRPGGHITGLSQMHPELSTKQFDLLKQLGPGVSRVGVLWNAANPAKAADWRELDPAARTLGVSLQSFEVRAPEDFEGAFAAVREQRPVGLLTLRDLLQLRCVHLSPILR
jgi:hypothetical protein